MSVQGNPSIVSTDLLLYYDFGNPNCYRGSGTSVYDISRRIGTGTAYGTPSFFSINGGCFAFANVNQYILGSSNGISSVMYSKLSFSVSCWFYLTSTAAVNKIPFGWDSDGIIIDTYPYISFYTSTGGHYRGFQVTPLAGQWYNVTCVYSAPMKYLYINGIMSGTGANLGANYGGNYFFPNDLFLIGRGSPGYTFPGRISMLKIYSRELTNAEVFQNYSAVRSRFGL